MKNILILTTLALLALISVPARAAILENPNGYNAFGDSGVPQGTTNSYYVAGNNTVPGGNTAVVRYLNVSSDLATSKLQFYIVTNVVTVTAIASGTTNFTVTSTNGYAAAGVWLLKHTASDTYERLKGYAVQNTNQLVSTYVPLTTVAVGDSIWVADPAGFFNVGAVSNNVPTGAGSFIYAGQYGRPLLLEINGTAWAQINAVSGDYR